MKKCFALKSQGKSKGWNCDEWAKKTPSIKSLPGHSAADQHRMYRGKKKV